MAGALTGDEDLEVRLTCAGLLRQIDFDRLIELLLLPARSLISALALDKAERPRAVAEALAEVVGGRSLDPLLALEATDDRVREAAADVLRLLREPSTQRYLIGALDNGLSAVAAAGVLGRLGNIPEMAELLTLSFIECYTLKPFALDHDVRVRIAGAEALARLGHPESGLDDLADSAHRASDLRDRLAAARALLQLDESRGLELLLSPLRPLLAALGTRDGSRDTTALSRLFASSVTPEHWTLCSSWASTMNR